MSERAETRSEGNATDTRSVSSSAAELLRSNEILRETVKELRRENRALSGKLAAAEQGILVDRRSRRAALNLMEDAIRARGEAQAVSEQLRQKITEREEAERALHESELRLTAAMQRFQTLSAEFDELVRQRTQELLDRESRLSRLAAQIKRVEWQERQRLARLLHDHVQQILVGAHMQVDLIAAGEGEPTEVELNSLKSLLRDAIHATRDLSVQLTPPLLHDQGLPAALEWLIARLTKEHGLRITTHLDDEADPATEEDRDILFQAAHEFLLNAAKHAGTKDVVLTLRRGVNRIELSVADRGTGFPAGKMAELGGSFGLLQLRQRLQAVAGALAIASDPCHGTTAVATIPDRETKA